MAREFVGIRLSKEATGTVANLQAKIGKANLQGKPSQARAIEYALAYTQMALDAEFDPIGDVVATKGQIR